MSDLTRESSIGVGATAEVFRVRHKNQPMALKQFLPVVTQDQETRKRLEIEVSALTSLSHPNIVGFYGSYEDELGFGILLELVQGGHLSQWAKSYKIGLIEPKLWVLAQVARGLGAAHEQGLLHRDLKPENILVSDSGEVKITDFGLAKSLSRVTITKSGLLIGSLAFMAPEVINLQDASAQSDIFSFGVLAYELLTGQNPFPSETPQGVIRKIMEGNPKAPRLVNGLVPEKISQLILKCLDLKPENRPETIWHVEAEILAVLSKSGLLSLSRPLVANSSQPQLLVEALRIKHQKLLAILEDRTRSLPEQLEALESLRTLFPNDERASQFFDNISTSQKPQKRQRIFVAAAILLPLLLLGAWMYWESPKEAKEAALPPRKAELVPAEPALQTANASAPSAPMSNSESKPRGTSKIERVRQVVAANAAPTDRGYLKFDLPQDVDVFVGGQFVPTSQWASFQVRPGKHLVKLVKEGFVPIERTVSVQAGQTSKIQAGGAQ